MSSWRQGSSSARSWRYAGARWRQRPIQSPARVGGVRTRLGARRGLVWAARLSPLLLCGLGLAQAIGLLSEPWWLIFLFVNLPVAGLRQVGVRHPVPHHYPGRRVGPVRRRLRPARDRHLRRAALERLRLRLITDGRSAYAHMRQLERIARLVLPRGAQVYWVVQAILLWDVHVLTALEGWQARSGRHVRAWLESLGRSKRSPPLAALAHAHPDWAVPELDESACQVEAEQAGHPLLPPDRRVDNDVALGPHGSFLLVTGSNMAGKSTYLRAIGTNVVLAQAGGPVCARAFRMPPLALCTSMRVVDSLEEGVSTFLAEVLRLKQVVDLARVDDGRAHAVLPARRGPPGHQHCRTPDRGAGRPSVPARAGRDRRRLDARPDAGRHAGAGRGAHAVHFRETLRTGPAGPIMTFDYRLAPGLATSTNALRLVALLGLDDGAGRRVRRIGPRRSGRRE